MLERLYNCGVYVPKVISRENNLIAMEYIEGVTLTDFIELAETDTVSLYPNIVAERLADWFTAFYDALPQGCIRGDVNCRNFIVTPDGNIAGVDFEEAYFGEREADLGRLIAFILTYTPQYTDYKKRLADILCEKFTARFDLDPVLVLQENNLELEDMIRRRQ